MLIQPDSRSSIMNRAIPSAKLQMN